MTSTNDCIDVKCRQCENRYRSIEGRDLHELEMHDSAETAQLTRAEEAYAHLASFQRGDVVDLAGEEFFQPGTIDLAQQHDGDDMGAAYVLVRGCGALTRVTVASLLDGMTLTLQNEAARGNVRYFDAVSYAMQAGRD